MDSFITVVPQNKSPVATLHEKQIKRIQGYLAERKNVFICGPCGVGKTYILKKVLEGMNHVELLGEHLRSQCLFLPFIKPSNKHVFIDEYEPLFKPIIEQVSDGNPISRGSLIVATANMAVYRNFETVFIPKHTPETLMTLVPNGTPNVYDAAVRARGNIRNFFAYLDGYDDTDMFQTPKEYVMSILTDPSSCTIKEYTSEHGHVWDIFQENYLNSKGVDSIQAAEAFSLADLFDVRIYSDRDWNPMPYFVLHALTIPALALGEPLIKEKIRPGSCWTKMNNYRMRSQKLTQICRKTRLAGIDELYLLRMYAEHGDLEPLISYGIRGQDFDVIKHLSISKGLKSRDVARIKKILPK